MNTNTQASMLQEEKELEDKLFGTPKVAETTETVAPVVPEVAPIAPVAEAVVAAETEKPVVVEAPVQEREEDWKLRFTNLRASRDAKLYDAQQALATTQAQIVTLQEQIQQLVDRKPEVVEDMFKDAFTEEEREALGETAIAAMQKTAKIAADAKTKKINLELQEAKRNAVEQAKRDAKTSQENAYNTFLNRLSNVVPDYSEVNLNPAFKTFMEAEDIDGMPRLRSFSAAESRGDAATVAKHMLDFKSTLNPKAQAKASLDAKVGPTGVAATATSTTPANQSDDITMSEINAHYKKHALGQYRGKQKEFLAMESRIDKAMAGGKIRG